MKAYQLYEQKSYYDLYKLAELLEYEVDRLNSLINHPIVNSFIEGFVVEQAYQSEKWDDIDKRTPVMWLLLIGHLLYKIIEAEESGDLDKARHHTISSSAVLFQWFKILTRRINDAKRTITE